MILWAHNQRQEQQWTVLNLLCLISPLKVYNSDKFLNRAVLRTK